MCVACVRVCVWCVCVCVACVCVLHGGDELHSREGGQWTNLAGSAGVEEGKVPIRLGLDGDSTAHHSMDTHLSTANSRGACETQTVSRASTNSRQPGCTISYIHCREFPLHSALYARPVGLRHPSLCLPAPGGSIVQRARSG